MTARLTLLRQKLKALAAHLTISIVLVGIAIALMVYHWFPGVLFGTDGGGVGLKLLLLVDLVLGPLLTFVVFNPGKARRLMVLDLSVIAVLQLGAYGYGLWNIHSVRVQALALHEGQFHSVTADRYAEQTIPPSDWEKLGGRRPYVVNVREPAAGEEASGVFAFGFTVGLEPYELQFLYEPLQQQAWQAGYTLAELQTLQPAMAASAQAWLRRHAPAAEAVRFVGLQGFYDTAVLAVDAHGQWLGGFAGALPKKPLKPSSALPRS